MCLQEGLDLTQSNRGCLLQRITIHTRTDQRKSDGFQTVFHGQGKTIPITCRQQLRFPLSPVRINRSYRVNHVTSFQIIPFCNFRLPGPASVQRPSNYVEGNAWQWAWFVPQDVEGLMELVGGQKSFEAHLDTLFTTSSELTGDPNAAADVTGMIGQYAHGNEPSHHIPYLYNYAGAPRKTQALVDHILRTLYHNDPNGLSGNEDVGQMSAWYALSAMGFYSFCPGRPVYEIGRPIFDKVTIHLSNGKDFVIQAKNNSVENKYIRSMKLNGEDLAEPRFSHFDLMKGGELIFEMEN